MDKLKEIVNEICVEQEFNCFFYEPTKEIWISGHLEGKKFDIFIKFIKNEGWKFIFETAEERTVALFKEEDGAIKRIRHILETKPITTSKEKEISGNVFSEITGLMSDDQIIQQELEKNQKEKSQ